MKPTETGHFTTRALAGLAADDHGDPDDRPPLVLLHGLTFDRTLWRPVLDELHRIDPGRRVLVLDLPGHGRSPDWPSYDIRELCEGVHRAVGEARLESPVVVGHSIGAIIATAYAARYPTSGVINIDQPLQVAPFVSLVSSLADKLRGPAFPAVWEMFASSMHAELLPEDARDLVRTASRPRQEVVVGYWREILDQPDEIAVTAAAWLAEVRARGLAYLFVAGSDVPPDYRQWLTETLPRSTVTVWPGSGHFPHLAHPDRFARCLAETAPWPSDVPSGAQPATVSAI